ncbi:MAG: class I SAM-dependent methyltransferase [Neisseria sp.]|nr:class I SAM-dependent methyltransferase [Neisseria sp.]
MHTSSLPHEWRSESSQKPPKSAVYRREANAAQILKAAHAGEATVWTGDFHNAKQVLAALKKRVRTPEKCTKPSENSVTGTAALFHRHRMKQSQQSRLINMLAVEIGANFTLDLPRAPDIAAALADVYGEPNREPFLLPLNRLLGFLGAHEWHKKGVDIPQLNGKIHVPFGVFSPLRGEYLDLVWQAPLHPDFQTAFDIGTGSGILAALLAERGLNVTGSDNNPRAAACARANLAQLGLDNKVRIEETDGFPEGRADLIVCNPPWLPAKPTSAVETALYDPDSAMLTAFLNGVSAHLNPDGEAWLIMSDLAEHLGLREPDWLENRITAAGLHIADKLSTKPQHAKAADASDPLAFARMQETTSLYRLRTAK